jgi:cellulose synthase operon protein C
MSEPTLDLHALTARYFDGELTEAEEATALAHLASCTQCQAELGDFVGLEVALQRPEPGAVQLAGGSQPKAVVAPVVAPVDAPVDASAPSAPPSPAADDAPISLDRARRERAERGGRGGGLLVPAGIIGALAAAAVVLMSMRVVRLEHEQVQLALAPSRGVEVRFSSSPFDKHRPYEVERGAVSREDIPLTALVALEKRGDRGALAVAQALRGEVTQARAALLAIAGSPQREADLAAAELLAGSPELALEAADRALALAPDLTIAHWNRGLALRELGLPLAAAAAFDEVSHRHEPGWAEEAASKATALRAAMADRGPRARAFTEAARAMVEHAGPALTPADATARPGLTRLYFHDALRTAATREQARALMALAQALDSAAGNDFARRAVEQVEASDFAVRAPLALAYRELLGGRAAGTAPALFARLAAAKTFVEDLRLGLAVSNRGLLSSREVIQLLEATKDPWFLLHVPRERAAALLAEGADDRAETELLTGLAGCDARLWAFRCARIAHDLTSFYFVRTRYSEAEQRAALSIGLFRESGATELEDAILSPLAEARRARGRYALAKATFREVIARLGSSDCASTRYATSGLTIMFVYRDASLGDVVPASPDDCGAPPSAVEVGAMVDLARMTGNVDDRTRAEQWIAAAAKAGAAGDAALAVISDVSRARLSIESAAGGAAQLRAALPKLAGTDETSIAFRVWVYQTLIDDAARRGAWADALTIVAEELGVPVPKACALAVSLDDTRGTAVALDKSGGATGSRATVKTPPEWDGAKLVPPPLRDAFAGCARVAVLARPPLQGRADLLPAELPWVFVGRDAGGAAPAAPATAPRRELFVGDALPPPALTLPALAPMPPHASSPEVDELRGPAATPQAVLAALAGATYAELHVHGQVDLGVADASFLALSPGADQRWALTAAEVRTAKLTAAPVVVLAACRAATTAPFEHKRWSLPDAFLAAGARAVIAPTIEIPDAEAVPFFAELRGRLAAGEEPAAALAALRRAYLAKGASWAASVILFN